ncbi:MAG TPA: electron transfer flavoprotein subunit alpha/FixB family protein [Pseudomonadaceae bacterium]|nr:electron transfer flavoprotein subunit alpha/FixB family protein [Pseudomonadaceae bacterium]
MTKALVIIEHDNSSLKAANASVVAAAAQLADNVDVLVAGSGCRAVAEAAAQLDSVQRVLLADHSCYEHQLAEPLAALVHTQAAGYDAILAAASTTGKNFLPRVAALLDTAQISEITAVLGPDTFVRPIYAGAALASVRSLEAVKVLTVRPSAFDPVASGSNSAEIVALDTVHEQDASRFVSRQLNVSVRPELGSARVVVSGGRGLGSAENFALLDGIADKLGAAIGASRAAVDAGYVGNELQVGQTGKVVAPELYIAVGISGAVQHLAGMKESKVIVAINKDPEAPILQVADYSLVADLFEVLPALADCL